MSARSLSLAVVGIILAAALAVSYLMARPSWLTQKKSLPIFVGEEIIVHKGVKAFTALKGKTAFKAETVVKALKEEEVLAPEPKAVTLLPIFPPKISYQVLPEYPLSAREQEREGTVLLSIYVGLNGNPDRVEIKSSSDVSELDQSALAAISQWRFSPATQGGRAIASWFEVPVRFVLN